MVRNRLFTFSHEDREHSDLAHFRCELQAIPLPNNSLDGALLHHGLELADDPRTAVRELSRVLAPGARLVVCGFNPMSLWGLRHAYARLFQDSFSGIRFVNPVRLQDWLAVLGFELCEEVRYVAYGLPFGRDARGAMPSSSLHPRRWGERFKSALSAHNPPVGGVYIISAVKQAIGMRPHWDEQGARSAKLAPVAYPKLSQRNPIERTG
jgi:SAM-dependent methyltransferase